MAGPRIDAGEDRRCVGSVGGGHGSLRPGRGEGAKDDVDDPLAGVCPRCDRRRESGVEQRSLADIDRRDVQDALVVGDLRVQERLQRVGDRRLGGVARDVDIALNLFG